MENNTVQEETNVEKEKTVISSESQSVPEKEGSKTNEGNEVLTQEAGQTGQKEQTLENPNALLAEPEESNVEEEGVESNVETTDSSAEDLLQGTDGDNLEELETTVLVTVEEAGKDYTFHFIIIGIVLVAVMIGTICLLIFKKKEREMSISRKNELSALSGGANNTSVKLTDTAKTCPVRIASIHGVGRRSAQQDSFGISEVKQDIDYNQKGVLAIVADGMGGLSDGDRVSQMVVVSMLQEFDEDFTNIPAASLLLKMVHDANVEVCDYLGEDKLGRCGSTLTAVIVKEHKLSWISVGDSHIYVYRKDKLVKMNQDHNYAAELDEKVKNGEISLDEAMRDPQRAALTSFIGMGELELVDQNENPIILERGDRILLMSDGVYGSVSEQKMVELMKMPLLSACKQIELEIIERNKKNQDNYTCVILEVK